MSSSSKVRPRVRALHVLHWLNRGGAETWLMEVLRGTDRSRCEIDFCCKGPDTGTMAPEARELGADVHHIPFGRTGVGFSRRLEQLLRSSRYDIVHCHLGALSESTLRAARRAGVRVRILMYHSHPELRRRLWMAPGPVTDLFWNVQNRLALRLATLVLASSSGVLASNTHGHLIPRTAVWYGPFDPVRFSAASPGEKPSGQPFEVVNIGSLRACRNQAAIVDTARILAGSEPRFRFKIYGRGAERGALSRRIAEFGLEEVVSLEGETADVPRALRSADIGFHPSFSESFSLAVVEYQASGLPVVAARIPGMDEALCPVNRSRARSPDDIEGFARDLRQLAADLQLRRDLARQGREYVEQNFSLNVCRKRLLAYYERELSAMSWTTSTRTHKIFSRGRRLMDRKRPT